MDAKTAHEKFKNVYTPLPDDILSSIDDVHLIVSHPQRPTKIIGPDGSEVAFPFQEQFRPTFDKHVEATIRAVNRFRGAQ